VGRISAQIDPLYFKQHNKRCAYFGMLEAEDNEEVFRALLETAESWLKGHGQEIVKGPFNLSINDELGLLVDGFDTSPYFMMGHAPKYYSSHISKCGYTSEKSLLAYRINSDFLKPLPMRMAILKTRENITLRSINKRNMSSEISLLRTVFNDAWSANWGFVPFTEEEFQDLGRLLKYILPSEYVQIAFIGHRPAAFSVLLPNFNELIKDFNGRLLPFNWLKLIYRIKMVSPRSARVALMGVKQKYQNSLLGAGLAYLLIEKMQLEGLARGIKEVELSWVLEDNYRLRKIFSGLGAEVYKRYQIFSKYLA
jgi:hypothetical protein